MKTEKEILKNIKLLENDLKANKFDNHFLEEDRKKIVGILTGLKWVVE